MKKSLKSFLLVVLCVVMVMPCFAAGAQFTAESYYSMKKILTSTPATIETTVLFPADLGANRGGAIIGNYDGVSMVSFTLEIHANGIPRLYIQNGGNPYDIRFSDVNVYTGVPVHLALTLDAANSLYSCYINGELKQTVSGTVPAQTYNATMCIGGDRRENNSQYCKGEIIDLAVYDDVRTASEISSDYTNGITDKSGLVVAYDMSEYADGDMPAVIPDLSGNGNNCIDNNAEFESYTSGLAFAADSDYFMEKKFSTYPSTIEATVFFPENFGNDNRGGVIIGDYDDVSQYCLNFEIHKNGAPRLYISNGANTYDVKFDAVNLYNGLPTHIAVVNDVENSLVHCYINGKLEQTVSQATSLRNSYPLPLRVGGDRRDGNAQYFKGRLINLALYEDARTADEVLNDYAYGYTDTEGMMVHYDMSEYSGESTPSVISDLSGNGNDCTSQIAGKWVDDVDLPKDYAYSFAVVGDTQIIAENYPQYMTGIYDWIVENADENKLKFVFGLGDITDENTNAEWALAKAAIRELDDVVPYSLVRGNHDMVAEYTTYFPYSEFASRIAGSYDGTMLNTYQYLTVNGIKYLIFGLDYGAADSVLNWASGIIEQNKDCNVIITTHAYLYRDGTTLDSGDVCPPSISGGTNNGDAIWDKLIKKHENIVLVLSGHDPCDSIILAQDKGENGNIVSQMLIDPQGVDKDLEGCGLVAMLYFSEDGSNVDVRYYSTVKKKYFMYQNQFGFDINVIESDSVIPVAPSTKVNDISFNVSLTADEYSGKIFAALYDEDGKITSVKSYDAEENVPVSFDKTASGKQIKIFWWNGVDTIVPVCLPEVIDVIN